MSILIIIVVSLSFVEPWSTGLAIDTYIPRTDLLEDLKMLNVASVASPLLLIAHIEIEYNQMEVIKIIPMGNHTL